MRNPLHHQRLRSGGSWNPAAQIRVPLTPRFGLVLGLVCLLQVALAAAIVAESPLPAILAVLAAFLLACLIEPRVAFIAPFFYLLTAQTELQTFTISDAIMFLGPITVICSALTGGEIAQRAGRLLKAHTFKFVIFFFSVLVVVAGMKALTSGAGPGSLQPLRLAIVPMVLLSLAVFRDRQEILRALRICFYTLTVYEFLRSMYFLATGGSATPSGVSTGGVRVAANSTAMFIVMAFVLLALHLGQEDRFIRRIGLSILMLLSTVTILLSLARTSWASGALVVLVLVVFVPRARRGVARFIATTAPLVILVALFAPIVAPDKVQSIQDRVNRPQGPVEKDQSAVRRQQSWSLMLDLWREDPVFGGGFGQEVSFTATDGTTKTIINDPHNGYIFLLASMGVVGLSAFLFVQLGFAVMATRAIRGSPIGNEIAIWALGSWIVFLAEIFLDVRLTPSNYMVFFWTLTAIPIALAALPERADPEVPEIDSEAPPAVRQLLPA